MRSPQQGREGNTVQRVQAVNRERRLRVLLDDALPNELDDEEGRADEGADQDGDPEARGPGLHALRGEHWRLGVVRVAPLVLALALALDEEAGGEEGRRRVGRDLEGRSVLAGVALERDGVGLELGAAPLVLLRARGHSSEAGPQRQVVDVGWRCTWRHVRMRTHRAKSLLQRRELAGGLHMS